MPQNVMECIRCKCRLGRGVRGGAWHRPGAAKPDVSFLETENQNQNTLGLELAAQMVEFLAVDPTSHGDRAFSLGNIAMAYKTAPLPGESAGEAGQMELAYIVGTFLKLIHEWILCVPATITPQQDLSSGASMARLKTRMKPLAFLVSKRWSGWTSHRTTYPGYRSGLHLLMAPRRIL